MGLADPLIENQGFQDDRCESSINFKHIADLKLALNFVWQEVIGKYEGSNPKIEEGTFRIKNRLEARFVYIKSAICRFKTDCYG